MISKIKKVLFGIVLFFISGIGINAQVDFGYNADYRYLKGSEAIDLADNWNQNAFDDNSWNIGTAPFWYGDGAGGTILDDMQGSYSVFYLRSEFFAENVNLIKTLRLALDYDDGFVIWINGKETLRQNAPAILTNTAYALDNHESGFPVSISVDSAGFELIEGVNTIAVQIFNSTLSSSDVHFDLKIQASLELPKLDASIGNVLFSHEAGFYNSPFQLTLTSPDTSSYIIYTLDGSDPRTSTTSFVGDSITSLEIDSRSNLGRPIAPSVIVRASVQKDGFAPSISRTRTYIFLEDVKIQSYPGAPWPPGNVNGQRIDLDMDVDVISDSRYVDQIEDAMMDIPTMSLVSDNGNFFDPMSGIYVNAEGHGIDWERDCSLELIDPNGEGFQVNAGMRIRGGASRGGWNPKHAFRLFFRTEYGDAKLEYPLFGDEGASKFDKIDLRTEQNYSWSKDGAPASDYNTFIKDIFSRRIQKEMGQPYARSRYYHLYLNGVYWGIFMTEERPEANYAESYFGDSKEDYDVVKVTTHSWPYYNIVTDGNMDAWEEIWNLCKKGLSANSNYFGLEGRDALGNPAQGVKVLVDIDNLIDYMAMVFYSGSFDGPVSAWYGEDMPNNYYAIYNRKNKGTGFVFFAHDMEHSMMVDPIYVGDGITENRVTIPDMSVAGLLQFHPQWLHFKLSYNAEYRQRFADRVYRYYHNEGLLSAETAKALFHEYTLELDKAIIAESARWGDSNASTARTKDDDWLPAINDLYDRFFPARTDIVIDQLKQANLLSAYSSPVFQSNGNNISLSNIQFTGSLSLVIKNSNGQGEICYTLDGTDPRLIGGVKASSAITSNADVVLDISKTREINARIKVGDKWSAISTLHLSSNSEDYSDLAITELHYHPWDKIVNGDTIPGSDMEFIEFKNIGENSMDISGMVLDSAIFYQVPNHTFLSPGAFYVVASKPEVFYDLYGMNPSGNYSKNFSNSGEYVLLTDSVGNEISSFTYDDDWPWPILSDGLGYSLVSAELNPTGDPSDCDYWRNSSAQGGSPFENDFFSEVDHSTVIQDKYSVYPNPANEFFTVQHNFDDPTDLFIFDISGKMVYANTFNTNIIIQTSDVGKMGLYLIKLRNRNSVTTMKLLVE